MVVDNEAGERPSTLQREQIAAARAQEAAKQEVATVDALTQQISGKVSQISAKMAVLDSAEMSQAMVVFNKTGTYPNYPSPVGDSVGADALREALTRIGDPYVWAAAGPDAFDCSGLVVWAYAQSGSSLEHFTGDLWNEGEHVPHSAPARRPVFFFVDYQPCGHLHRQRPDGRRTHSRPGRADPADLLERLRRRGPHRLTLRTGSLRPPRNRPAGTACRSVSCAQDAAGTGPCRGSRPGQHDEQPVDAHAHAAAGRHAVLQRAQEVLV